MHELQSVLARPHIATASRSCMGRATYWRKPPVLTTIHPTCLVYALNVHSKKPHYSSRPLTQYPEASCIRAFQLKVRKGEHSLLWAFFVMNGFFLFWGRPELQFLPLVRFECRREFLIQIFFRFFVTFFFISFETKFVWNRVGARPRYFEPALSPGFCEIEPWKARIINFKNGRV